MDPCSALTPEQADEIGFSGPGEGRDTNGYPECVWMDLNEDGIGGAQYIDLALHTHEGIDQLPHSNGGESVEVNGRTWTVYAGDAVPGACIANIAVTDSSSVELLGENIDEPARLCDGVRATIPYVTANLPVR